MSNITKKRTNIAEVKAKKTAYNFTESQRIYSQAHELIACGSQGTRQPIYPDFPIYFKKAKGCRMWDVDGNEFIDLLCSIGPVILGYAYDRVDNAVKNIIDESFQSSMNHPVQLELAKVLIEMIPSAERVKFLKTGTAATMCSVRLARYITGRTHIARCGYHGWADLWLENQNCGVHKTAWQAVKSFDGTADSLQDLFRKNTEKFAAVILCPADTKPFTKENYQNIVNLAHEHGAIVIFDEIKTGFRVAPGGAQQLLGVMPDITTVSKGMANGYPISAVVGKKDFMDKANDVRVTGTFSVEALSITAALETLKEIKEQNVVDHLWKKGQSLIDGLNQICSDYGIDGAKAYADPVPPMPRFIINSYEDPVHNHFFELCHKYGLFFSPWHVGFVNYSHKDNDIDEILDICDFVASKLKKDFVNKSFI